MTIISKTALSSSAAPGVVSGTTSSVPSTNNDDVFAAFNIKEIADEEYGISPFLGKWDLVSSNSRKAFVKMKSLKLIYQTENNQIRCEMDAELAICSCIKFPFNDTRHIEQKSPTTFAVHSGGTISCGTISNNKKVFEVQNPDGSIRSRIEFPNRNKLIMTIMPTCSNSKMTMEYEKV